LNIWRWFAAAVAVALAWTGTATATVVIEKDLDDIAREADMVFVGRVVSVESRWRDEKRRSIETVVTFHVVEALHGVDQRQVALAFAGGEIDGLSEVVAGMPEFRAGEEVVLFASRKASISPVIGFNQGCFRIEGGRVLTSESAPVTGTSERGLRLGAEGQPGMPLGEFLDDVRRRLERRGGGDS
jgi:hypothetical protein